MSKCIIKCPYCGFESKTDRNMKYIDAEKLKAEIKRRIDATINIHHIPCHRREELEGLLSFIDSLQQEQPKQSEVDLKKEVEKFCLEYDSRKEVWFDMTPMDKKMLSTPTWSNFAASIASHFFELGLNARKL